MTDPVTLHISPEQARAFGKVAVLFGGRSAEREVSLTSGRMVLAALQSQGVDAIGFDPSLRGLDELKRDKIDRVFIALHGRWGEDGTVQGALELLDIPYTGSGVCASAMAMDKAMTKRLWATEGIPMPSGMLLDQAMLDKQTDLLAAIAPMKLPLIVKPPLEGSTLGLSRVRSAEQLRPAIELCLRYDQHALVEELIEGPEFTVTLLQRNGRTEALPVIEIRAPQGNYDYQNKYHTDVTQYLCPAPISSELSQRMQSLAVQAFDTLGCRTWARVDVMLRASDQSPFLLEINTSPGMTDHSLVPMAARAAGMSYAQLVLKLLESASLKNQGEARS